jgi:hypothetical protein
MPDMNDKNLVRLAKATKVSAPILPEAILDNLTNINTPRRLTLRITAIAACLALAVGIGATFTPAAKPLASLKELTSSEGLYSSVAYSYLNAHQGSLSKDWLNFATLIAGRGLSTKRSWGYVYQLETGNRPERMFSKLASTFDLTGKGSRGKTSIALATKSARLDMDTMGTGAWSFGSNGLNVANCLQSFYFLGCNNSHSVDPDLINRQASNQIILKKTLQVFATSGYLADPGSISIARSNDGITARSKFLVEGTYAPLEWEVTFDPNGKIVGAKGHYFSVHRVGAYDVVSPKKALARFNYSHWRAITDRQFTFAWKSDVLCYCGMVSAGSPQGGFTDPAPSYVVSSLDQTLGLVFDAGGGAWLVPAYSLPEFPTRGVIAVENNVFKLPR